MRIEAITLRELQIPLVHFFETSFGRTYTRRVLLVTLHCDGLEGWGECVAGENPYYSEEYIDGAWDVIVRYLGPALLGKTLQSGRDVPALLAQVREHRMAKAALENAAWDAEAQEKGVPLWKLLGGTRREIACGVSIGIQDSHEQLLRKDRDRTGGRIPAHQDQGQARLGCRSAGEDPQALAGHSSELRRKFRLHAGRRAASEELRPLQAADDRAAVVERRFLLPRATCRNNCRRRSAWMKRFVALAMPKPRWSWARAASSTSKLGGSADFPRRSPFTMSRSASAFPCGAEGCWSRVSAAPTMWHSRRCRISSCPAMSRRRSATGKKTSSSPRSKISDRSTIAVTDKPGRGYEIRKDLIEKLTVRKEELR